MDENTKEKKDESSINVSVEIDYYKLATALLQAQKKAKVYEEEKFTKSTFSFLTSGVLYVIGVLGFLITLLSLGYAIYYVFKILQWTDDLHITANIISCIFILAIVVCIGILSFMLFKSGQEIQKSEDKHFIVAVFSALSGFIALIVALVSLFK